jgi:hypothetical protein
METIETRSACDVHADEKTDPNDGRSSWLFTVESGFLRRIVILNLLLGLYSAAYTIDLGRFANFLSMSYMSEGEIIVSGDINQQRDAVLANIARYGNR